MDNLYKTHSFDLQLFAEEDKTVEELLDNPIVKKDEDGNYHLDFGDAEDEDESEKQTDDDQEQEEVVDEPEDEPDGEDQKFTISTEEGEVEVTLQELKDGYLRRKDYTKKTQDLAEQRKALKPEPEKKVSLPNELAGAEKIDLSDFNAVQDFLREKAIEQVKQKLKVPDFYEDDLKHMSAYMDIRNDLAMKLNGEVKKQERINNFANELKAQDSRFEEIWQYIGKKREELPYKIVAAMDKAMLDGDTATLGRVYQEFRKDFYAENVTKTPTLKTKQTKVAQPVKSEPVKPVKQDKYTLDFAPKDLRDMDHNEKLNALLKLAALEDED